MSSAGVMDLEVPPVEVTKPRIPVPRRILIVEDNEMAAGSSTAPCRTAFRGG